MMLVTVWPGAAWADEEVRIALLQGVKAVEVRGDGLALFDGKEGKKFWSFKERGSARLVVDGPNLKAGGLGPTEGIVYGLASSIFVEAKGTVQVGESAYFGRIEIRRGAAGDLLVVNRLPMEVYLLGIIGAEMPAEWPIEALKAQAVASRTYALYRLMNARAANRSFDLSSTVVSQVYRGAEVMGPSTKAAVESTRGQVLSYDREFVEALFHSTCGGHTLSSRSHFGGARPYLAGRPCPWCRSSERYRWNTKMKWSTVAKKLESAGVALAPVRNLRRDSEAKKVRLEDRRGKRYINARTVRKALGWTGLYSERFRADKKGPEVHFEGRGYGHGVGMCQWGAKGMAEVGKTYKEILAYYYQGTRLEQIY